MDESTCRKDLIEIEKRAYEKGLLTGSGGNSSIRLAENEILITPSGVCKGFLSADQLIKLNMQGEVIAGIKGYMKPARDYRMHLALYKLRPNIRAVVHAHPPVATGFAIAALPLTVSAPEVLFTFGGIGVTRYSTPTTEQVPEVIKECLAENPTCEAILLASHGAVTIGVDIWDAYYKMEALEGYLTSVLVARLLGREEPLTATQLREIERLMYADAPKTEQWAPLIETIVQVVRQKGAGGGKVPYGEEEIGQIVRLVLKALNG